MLENFVLAGVKIFSSLSGICIAAPAIGKMLTNSILKDGL